MRPGAAVVGASVFAALAAGGAGRAHAVGWGPLPARIDGRDPKTIDRPRSITLAPEEGGEHWRFETWNGPVHLWTPPGYDADTAGIVLYVHGLYTPVDRAWKEHRLARQFAASGINALFVAPEAPTVAGEPVRWADLGVLLGEVDKRLQAARPTGPVVAIGHSGAYRTLAEWLAWRPLADVVLLDALYGGEDLFHAWLAAPPWLPAGVRPPRRRADLAHKRLLLVVARSTLETTREFLKPVRRQVVRVAEVPASAARLTRKMRAARLLDVRSTLGHHELVTTGAVIPVMLRATRLGDVLVEPPAPRRQR